MYAFFAHLRSVSIGTMCVGEEEHDVRCRRRAGRSTPSRFSGSWPCGCSQDAGGTPDPVGVRAPDTAPGPFEVNVEVARMTVSEAQGQLPAERRARLLELLRQQKIARVHDLASDLAVSAITIRR